MWHIKGPSRMDYIRPSEDLRYTAVNSLSQEEYEDGRERQFGTKNPEVQDIPFYNAMIREDCPIASAYEMLQRSFEMRRRTNDGRPTWTMRGRFAQSTTCLPDGRMVEIGGRYGTKDEEDYDYCIYNDVLVVRPDGTFTLYGYPENTFPPTDYHTATLMGKDIYLIGGLGYERKRGEEQKTQVFRLSTEDFSMHQVKVSGKSPGWIYRHQSEAISDHEIFVHGPAKRADVVYDGEVLESSHIEPPFQYVLNVRSGAWEKPKDESLPDASISPAETNITERAPAEYPDIRSRGVLWEMLRRVRYALCV
ncbi:hypothetical protein Hte_000448 [Hypoxylon texense]